MISELGARRVGGSGPKGGMGALKGGGVHTAGN